MDQKEEIKQKIDIVDLIMEYMPLKQAGSVSWKGLCPFHSEKSPSFHVSRDRQIWHCFGCGEGGDCFAFVMRMESMDFPEALRHLGTKVGIEVQRFTSTESNDKQRLVSANTFAANVYRKVLIEATYATAAREYLLKRGITEALSEKFSLGFAPDAWDTLALSFVKRGLPELDGERAGLLMRRKQGSGFIDRFRNRIMIPLRDAQGNVVGFTGRIFGTSAPDVAKYMNSPETAVYHKGSILYGLDLAKKGIREKGSVIIVEGNLDVIASHKAGIENIVASSGTALTEMQLQLLKRYTTTIIFSFDADAAGFKAAQRGITLARQTGFDVRVAVLPATAGKDPDEAVQKDPELWRKAVEKTLPIMQYYLDRATAGKDLNNVDDKRKISAFILPELSHIGDVVEREHWLQIVADLLRIDVGELRRAVAKAAVQPPPNGIHPHPLLGKEGALSRHGEAPPLTKGRTGGVASVAARPSRENQSLEILFGLFINQPEQRSHILNGLPVALIPSGTPLSALYTKSFELYSEPRSSSSGALDLFRQVRESLQALAEPDRSVQTSVLDSAVLQAEQLAVDLTAADLQRHVRQLIEAVTSSEVRRQRKELEADLRRAERAGNKEEVQRLLESYRHLS